LNKIFENDNVDLEDWKINKFQTKCNEIENSIEKYHFELSKFKTQLFNKDVQLVKLNIDLKEKEIINKSLTYDIDKLKINKSSKD
jgi:hypothetical protein